MKSIKSKVIATLFALCFALLGYSCQCEAQEKYEVVSITVETKENKGYESDKKTYALVGGQLALNAVVETEPAGKAAKVNWSSNNENVTVDKNGLVTIKEGATAESVEITATSAMDETKSDSITLTLYSIDLTITSAKDSVSINKTLQLTATANSTPSDIPEVLKKASWSSSDEAIATVSDTGLVTAKETEGSVTITATLPGGKTETKVLQVVTQTILPNTEKSIAFYSTSPFTLKTGNETKNWKKADNDTITGYIGWCSINSGNDSDWQEWNGTAISAAKDENNPDPEKYYIFLRGKGNGKIVSDNTGDGKFVITSTDPNNTKITVTLDGNMMNLLDCTKDYTKPENLKIHAAYCFANLFMDCTQLETLGPDFSLPATDLYTYCYYRMFGGCTSLTSAPVLPATTLANSCYNLMFYKCTSLTSVPALPATTLADHCYSNMFYGCTSLKSAPALPATTLADYCYYGMFNGCKSLKFSATQNGEYINEFKLGDASGKTDALNSMFVGTGGTFNNTPTGNTTYYTSNTVVSAN